jgi:dephospho-CoA kinase
VFRILAVAGFDCVGKTTLSDLLAERLNADRIELSSLVLDAITDAPDSIDMDAAIETLRKQNGARWLADRVLERVCDSSDGSQALTVVSGFRHLDTFMTVTSVFRAFTLAVSCPLALRAHRLAARSGRPASLLSAGKSLIAKDRLHSAWGLDEILSQADWRFSNSRPRRRLDQEAERVISQLRIVENVAAARR